MKKRDLMEAMGLKNEEAKSFRDRPYDKPGSMDMVDVVYDDGTRAGGRVQQVFPQAGDKAPRIRVRFRSSAPKSGTETYKLVSRGTSEYIEERTGEHVHIEPTNPAGWGTAWHSMYEPFD